MRQLNDKGRRRGGRCALLALLAACASAAWAGPAQTTPAAPPSEGAVADHVETKAPPRAFDFGQPADLGKLEQSRGGTDTHNTMNLDGVVSGNSAVNVVTGNNTIDAGAFANMSGIPVVIQNSGANVLIQSATIVNLQFK